MKGSRMADKIISRVDSEIYSKFDEEEIKTTYLDKDTLKEIADLKSWDKYSLILTRLTVSDYSSFEDLSAYLGQTYVNNAAYNTPKEVQDDIRFLLEKVWDWMESFQAGIIASEVVDTLNKNSIDTLVLEDYGDGLEEYETAIDLEEFIANF